MFPAVPYLTTIAAGWGLNELPAGAQPRCFIAAVVLGLMPLMYGCKREKPDFSQVKQKQAEVVEQPDPLVLAFEYLNRPDEFESSRVEPRVLYHLNQWIQHQQPDKNWTADPLHTQVPARISRDLPTPDLARLKFDARDVEMIRECVWMRDVSKSVVRREQQRLRRRSESRALPGWYDEFAERKGERAADDLLISTWLFDWTIRHVQLDPMPEIVAHAAGPRSDPPGGKEAQQDEIHPVSPVPGGRLTAWEVVLLGHGDALERAKVFIALARQQEIDVVMLHPVEADPERGWLAGALISDDLYLFDTKLGLPIPEPDGRPVATLAEAMADPSVIRALDIDRQHRYPLKQSEIEGMVAYIDAPPELLSLRMQLLERELAGESATVLTADPGSLSRRLRRSQGVADVRLWLAPYETRSYRIQLDTLLRRLAQATRTANSQLADRVRAAYDRQAVEQLHQEMQIFVGLTPMVRGRLLQLRGQFDQRDQRPGAKGLLLQCRPAEEEIARLTTDKALQRELIKLHRLPDNADDEQLQRAVAARAEYVKQVKQNASYWLGLIAYEDGQYKAAIHLLDELTLRANPEGLWSNGARYNLARAHEALARQTGAQSDFDRAVELYRGDGSPQRLGNQIRAKRLQAPSAASSETD